MPFVRRERTPRPPKGTHNVMKDFKEALATFLAAASTVSDRFVVLSLRDPGWVEACVQTHVAQLT